MKENSDDKERQHTRFLVYLATITAWHTPSRKYYFCNHIEWDEHVATLQFKSPRALLQMYWMEIASFNKACSWLEPILQVDPVMSSVCTGKGAIIVEVEIHSLLRRLAGGSRSDVGSSICHCQRGVLSYLLLDGWSLCQITQPSAIHKSAPFSLDDRVRCVFWTHFVRMTLFSLVKNGSDLI